MNSYLHGIEILTPAEQKRLIGDHGITLSGSGRSVYDIVTGKILDYIEKNDQMPWQKPWKAARNMMAKNFVSKKPYRGINSILLGMAPTENPYFLTAKQVKDLKGNIKKGAESYLVVFYAKTLSKTVKEKDPDTGKEKKKTILQELDVPVLRYYLVFNGEDIEGIDWKLPKAEELNETDQIESCENIIAGMPKRPLIKELSGDDAYYSPSKDIIVLPKREQFKKIQQFYSVAFHEMIHSTKHDNRLGSRGFDVAKKHGDKGYTKEELVAEIGASFLCSEAGILFATLEMSVAYLKGWNSKLVQVFKEDPKFIVIAAGLSQRAADFILGKLETNQKPASSDTKKESGNNLLVLAQAQAQARIRILKLSEKPIYQKIVGLNGLGGKEVIQELPEAINAKYEWLKDKYPSTLLLFRNDLVYRAYFAEDTGTLKRVLKIKPTIGKNGILHADIKVVKIDTAIRTLVDAGHRVALIDMLQASQIENAVKMARERISKYKKN